MAQLGQYGPHAVVEVGKHRGKDPALYVLNVRELFHVLIRSLQWTVHGVVGDVQKEWMRLVSIDEIDRLAGERIGEVLALVNRLASAHDRVVGIVSRLGVAHVGGVNDPAVSGYKSAFTATGQYRAPQPSGGAEPRVWHEVMPLMGEPEKLVEPMSERMKLSLSAKVPFTNQAIDVADISQQFGQRLLVARQADSG